MRACVHVCLMLVFLSFKYQGFGGRLLRDQGWKDGVGLGKKEQGISEPLLADGQTGHNKQGLG